MTGGISPILNASTRHDSSAVSFARCTSIVNAKTVRRKGSGYDFNHRILDSGYEPRVIEYSDSSNSGKKRVFVKVIPSNVANAMDKESKTGQEALEAMRCIKKYYEKRADTQDKRNEKHNIFNSLEIAIFEGQMRLAYRNHFQTAVKSPELRKALFLDDKEVDALLQKIGKACNEGKSVIDKELYIQLDDLFKKIESMVGRKLDANEKGIVKDCINKKYVVSAYFGLPTTSI